jgi:predicted PurR-regulated permease PerM
MFDVIAESGCGLQGQAARLPGTRRESCQMPPSNEHQSGADIPPAAPSPSRAGVSALNAGAVVVAALYFGRELLVPLVLAVLLAFVLAPVVVLLQRARLGKAPAVLVAVALAFTIIGGIGAVVGGQATTLAGSLPSYQATIQEKMRFLATGTELLDRLNNSLHALLGGAEAGTVKLGPAQAGVEVVPSPSPAGSASDLGASSALIVVRTIAQPLLGPLASVGIVIVFVIFVLLSREDLRDRLVRLVGRKDMHRTILAMNDAARRLSRYFLIQLALNSGFGAFIAMGLWFAGLPSPLLWGILAGLMRFVPFIGSFIAVLPPFLLALAAAPGWSLALVVLALFLVSDMAMGQVVEPLLYGHSTGLSPIAVIISAAFWAFLWGPVGLLIATPLTVCLVVIGRHVESLAFLNIMLGDSPPLEPAETFYQRALEGHAKELAAQARKAVGSSSLAQYYDQVAMRGLALAQADLSRDTLAFERLEAIHRQIEALLSLLAGGPGAGAQGRAAPPGAEWQAEGAVVCIPGRGQLDDLAATMAVQVMQDAGFAARSESNAILGAGRGEPARLGSARLCCLSVLEQGSSASGIRYLLRRIQRQMPHAAVVVCLWHAEGASPLLGALRAEGSEENIVLSLGELVALARAISARRPQPVASLA